MSSSSAGQVLGQDREASRLGIFSNLWSRSHLINGIVVSSCFQRKVGRKAALLKFSCLVWQIDVQISASEHYLRAFPIDYLVIWECQVKDKEYLSAKISGFPG
jgi:hypothetical protein